ncbi:DUF218 domain-containing protein YdcF [Clostridium sediminicola]|uniref:YdcF family protein n=1 Tax=Clostridium sediminicola TaxID=3114879 RepID=UPI0031F1E76D
MKNNKTITKEQINDINIISSFLSKRDIDSLNEQSLYKKFGILKVDMLILLGNSLIYTVEIAAKAFRNKIAKELMVVGGIGHSTELLRRNVENSMKYKEINCSDKAEAEIIKEILCKYCKIAEESIITENKSTNCGSNANESLKVIQNAGKEVKSVILIQDPTMQLRTYASFKKEWKNVKDIRFINYAPLVPQMKIGNGNVSYTNNINGLWDIERFLSLIMGEIPRIIDNENGYGPEGKGFIDHVDVPNNIIRAYERLTPFFSDYVRTRYI